VDNATINLVDRPYQEIVDDILTAMLGGVVSEPIYFDIKEDRYPLSKPATAVTKMAGTHNGVRTIFQQTVDYLFDAPPVNAITWQDAGTKPDDESTFYVDYLVPNSLSPLTDTNVGSVTRTLTEAIGREIATVYQQINAAYLSGFVDTATGVSLDYVVSILGVVRKTKDYAVGIETFFRDPNAPDGNITIPEGTVLNTTKGEATFVTTQLCTLQRGQARVDAPIRASDASKGAVGRRIAGDVSKLAQSLSGISRVTNFDATVLGAADESDDDLRSRAKAALQGIGNATLAALEQTVLDENCSLDDVRDPNSANSSPPGTVYLLVEAEPVRFPSLQAAVNETRAAGILATVVARYVFFKPRLVATIPAGITAAGKPKLVGQIIDAMQSYVNGLKPGGPALGKNLIQAITQNVIETKDPKNLRFQDVMAWQADVANPVQISLPDQILQAISGIPNSDVDALRLAIEGVLSPNFSERRIPNRGLVQNLSGAPATPQDIEDGKFQVVSKIRNETNWSVILDVEPGDIVLVER
jgi:hypothetical protein